MNEENIQEVTTTEETPVEESPKDDTREVCGIKIPNTDAITDDEVIEFINSLNDFTAIEVLHHIKKFRDDLNTLNMYSVNLSTAMVTYDTYKNMASMYGNIDNDLVTAEFDNPEDENGQIDFEQIRKDIEEYDARLKVGLAVLEHKYAKIRESGIASIKDDIIETLLKNLDTVKQSEDVNKEYTVKAIQKIIDEFNNAPDGIVDQYERISRKLSNPKRNLELVKYVTNHPDDARKEFLKIGFTDEMYDAFCKFLIIEDSYNRYITDDVDEEDDLTQDKIKRYVYVYFYHISKIVNSEIRKKNYLSLIYKCNVLQVIELGSIDAENFRGTVDCNDNRKNAEPNSDLDILSKRRQKLYSQCMKIFSHYPL